MAEKLPVIIDNRGDNTVVSALCRRASNDHAKNLR